MIYPYASDNDAIISVARLVTASVNPKVTSFVRDSVIRGSWETLLTEGKYLPLRDPAPEELAEFFEAQRALVRRHSTSPRDERQLLKALAASEQSTGAYLKPHVFYTWQHLADLSGYTLSRKSASNPLTIAVDLDGCLYDFTAIMRDWLISRGWDPEDLIEPTRYNLSDEWGIDASTFQSEMKRSLGNDVMFRVGEPFPDAIRAVQQLGKAGHAIVANSARLFAGMEDKSRAATVQWLRENGIHPDDIHLADPTDPKDKLRIKFDLLIDDHPGNVEAAIKAGRGAVLLDRSWNEVYEDLPRASYAAIARNPHAYIAEAG